MDYSNSIALSGAEGAVVWGWHTAASLGSWTLSNGTLTAKVLSHDEFRASQQPLTFQVQRPSGHVWKWTIQSLQITGQTLTAAVDP